MAFLRSLAAVAGFRSKHLRYLKAVVACIGFFFICALFLHFAGANEKLSSVRGLSSGLTVAFIMGVVLIWRRVMTQGGRTLDDFAKGLKEQARGEYRKIESYRTNEEWELRQLEGRVAELKASIGKLATSEQRLNEFHPVRDGKLRCPRCWVKGGIESNLATSEANNFDRARCLAPGCKFVLDAP